MTTYPAITLTLANTEIISGSDHFKTAMGAYISIEENPADGQEYFDFFQFSTHPKKEGMSAIEANFDLLEEVNDLSFFNSYKIPCRIYEDIDFGFDNHLWWEAYMLGGDFVDKTYVGVLDQAGTVMGDHSITKLQLPYHKYDSNIIDYASGESQGNYIISITPSYSRHYQEYINYSNQIDSERSLPNAYLLQTIEDNPDPTVHSPYIWQFVTLEGAYPDVTFVEPDSLLDPVLISTYLPPIDSADSFDEGAGTGFPTPQFEDIDLNLRNYYSASLLRYPLSQSTIDIVDTRMRNILFDQQAVAEESKTIADNISKIPFYITIDFQSLNAAYVANFDDEVESIKYVKNLITEHNLSSKFIKDLKDLFGQAPTEEAVENMIFSTEKHYLSGSGLENVYEIDSTTFRTIGFAQFINYAYRKNVSPSEESTMNCYFVGPGTLARSAAMQESLLFAHYNSINMAHFIKDFEELANTTLAFSLDKGALESETVLDSVIDLSSYYAGPDAIAGDQHKYMETLAYRVEKIGGRVESGGTYPVLQDFWIAEGVDDDDIVLHDSQIRYGQDYTYNVYAYVLVCGNKYLIEDVRLSKPAGIVGEEAADYEGWHCLQWYDPISGENASQLYEIDEDNALLGINTFADNTQSISKTYQYLADFYLNFEASAKIIEIPIATKTLKVLDNPPNTIEVSPFQLVDNSQIIGFDIRYENFTENYVPPKIVTLSEHEDRSSYIHSLDMIDIENAVENQVNRRSISRQAAFEVFRIDQKPIDIADFNNQIISTIDLKIENSKNTLSQAIFYDKIATNRKYYYLFRAVNEQGVPGFISEVYEAELVDDGAFKFSIFDAFYEEDLDPTRTYYTEPSKSFKKLFMIKPNINQIALDTTDVNLLNDSHEEFENISVGQSGLEETIWGKTFKLRLTSKKTGKKMDINITYKNVNQ